ncbi:hypothetical protein [Ereboglobus luteus]|uniref:Uncharacterized protein n=1 Tax=Ereboglobus luteus TaxID=1796921 RepID=A0A2U8E5B9_9BACT|nr:hypothetical protein [Ereboglobus luteus]AWI10026.1 hypothetical protein CKA38_12875 [Ereboglobus luteus]
MMKTIRQRHANLVVIYKNLEAAAKNFTDAQNKEHRNDSTPLKKYNITDEAEISIAMSLDRQDSNWTRMDSMAKQADVIIKSIAPLLDKLEIIIEGAEARMEERNDFYNESLEKTIAMLKAATTGIIKAFNASTVIYGKTYHESVMNKWIDGKTLTDEFENAVPAELENKRRAHLKQIEQLRAELEGKTQNLLESLQMATDIRRSR